MSAINVEQLVTSLREQTLRTFSSTVTNAPRGKLVRLPVPDLNGLA